MATYSRTVLPVTKCFHDHDSGLSELQTWMKRSTPGCVGVAVWQSERCIAWSWEQRGKLSNINMVFIKFPLDVSDSCDYGCCSAYYQSVLLSVSSPSAFCRPPCNFLVSSEGKLKQTAALRLFEGIERGHGFTCPATLYSATTEYKAAAAENAAPDIFCHTRTGGGRGYFSVTE